MAWVELTNAETGKTVYLDPQCVILFEELDDTTTLIRCGWNVTYRVLEGVERVAELFTDQEAEDLEEA